MRSASRAPRCGRACRSSQRWGLEVEAVPGAGYRLRRAVDLLDAAALRAALSLRAAALVTRLDVFTELDSTNRYLLNLPPPPAGELTACLAEFQNCGPRPPRPPLEHAARRRPVLVRGLAVRRRARGLRRARARGRRRRAPRAGASRERRRRAQMAERPRRRRAQARRNPARAQRRSAGRLPRGGGHRHQRVAGAGVAATR